MKVSELKKDRIYKAMIKKQKVIFVFNGISDDGSHVIFTVLNRDQDLYANTMNAMLVEEFEKIEDVEDITETLIEEQQQKNSSS